MNSEKELESLKNQINTIKVLYLVLIIILVTTVVSFQIQYSRIQSYYQSSQQTNQEISQRLENVNSDFQEQNAHLQSVLSEMKQMNQ